MSESLEGWLASCAAGQRYLQFGGLAHPGLQYVPQALRAGAREAIQMEPTIRSPADWTALREACAPHGAVLSTMVQDPLDGHQLARRLGNIDIIHITQLFHERDPYLLLARMGRHAKRALVVTSVVIPAEECGLQAGDALAAYLPEDPRLAAVDRALLARGVALHQFRAPPDQRAANGIATWEGMWNWFHTEAALHHLVSHFGWRVTHGFRNWGDLGLTLVAER